MRKKLKTDTMTIRLSPDQRVILEKMKNILEVKTELPVTMTFLILMLMECGWEKMMEKYGIRQDFNLVESKKAS